MLSFKRLKAEISRLKYNKYRKILNALDKNLRIYGKVIIKNPENISIGYNCRLNDYTFLHGAGGLVIEDDVTISAFAKLISYGYDTDNWQTNYLSKLHKGNSIHIGKGTWIGSGAIVLAGVQITGQGVIVAAGSIVTKNIDEDFVVVAGNPAKVIKHLT